MCNKNINEWFFPQKDEVKIIIDVATQRNLLVNFGVNMPQLSTPHPNPALLIQHAQHPQGFILLSGGFCWKWYEQHKVKQGWELKDHLRFVH